MRDEGSHRHATGDRGPERGRWEVEGAWVYRGLVTVEPSRGCHTVLEASPDTEPMMDVADWTWTGFLARTALLYGCTQAQTGASELLLPAASAHKRQPDCASWP